MAEWKWGDYLIKKLDKKSNKYLRFRFWRWFLINAVLNLIDVKNMEPDMETSFKLGVLIEGRTVFFKRNNTLYCLPFADGGEEPVYAGEIISVRVTNPVLGEFRGTPGVDCVPVYFNTLDRVQMSCGLSWLIDETADALSDNDLSIRCVQRLKRLPTIFVGHTTPERLAMEQVLKSVEDGETEIIAQSALDKSVQRLDAGQSTVPPLFEFTEYQQYKLGQFYNMLGVNSVWNTKRERVAASENDAAGETARYNVADIVQTLNEQLTAVNTMFGTEFAVELTLINAAKIDREIEQESEPDPEPDPEQVGGETNADMDNATSSDV